MTYTITVTDSGQTPYTGAAVTDTLAGVLGRRGLQRRRGGHGRVGVVRRPGPDVDREPVAGGSATITYSVTVSNPDTGSHVLTNTVTSTTAGATAGRGSATRGAPRR